MQALTLEEFIALETGFTIKAYEMLDVDGKAKAAIDKAYEDYLESYDQALEEGKSGKEYGAIRV